MRDQKPEHKKATKWTILDPTIDIDSQASTIGNISRREPSFNLSTDPSHAIKGGSKNVIIIIVFTATNITITCLYNIDPIKPHLYIVKLGFTGVYFIFPISA